jgi:two-component system phosphate regulon sensor histidine kinase PhoR
MNRFLFIKLSLALCFVVLLVAFLAYLVSLPLAILTGCLLVTGIILWGLSPLSKILSMASSLGSGHLPKRIFISRQDEWGQLGHLLNQITQQVEDLMYQIQSEKGEIQLILKNMVEHVLVVDLSGKILFMNPAAEKFFALTQGQGIHKSFMEVIRQPVITEILQAVLQTGQAQSKPIQLFVPQERFFEARALPLLQGNQRLGALLVLHDVTRIQTLEKVRREFVANVSHELKTPLTTIQGMAETLLHGALKDSKHNQEFVETIYKQSQQLSNLVEDLLDLSAIESGKKELKRSEIDLEELFEELVADFGAMAQKNRVHLQVHLPDTLTPIQLDRVIILQVFRNLIDNAIKFNRPEGQVLIGGSQQEDSITLWIKDTGHGIPPEDLPRIFERFYRVEKARSRERGGTGLGLALVKHGVEAHGGSVSVSSTLGEGSIFTITLPI